MKSSLMEKMLNGLTIALLIRIPNMMIKNNKKEIVKTSGFKNSPQIKIREMYKKSKKVCIQVFLIIDFHDLSSV